VLFNGTPTLALQRQSRNISSVTKLGTGRYEINFSIGMQDTNFVLFANGFSASDPPDQGVIIYETGPNSSTISRSTTSAIIETRNMTTFGKADCAYVNVCVIR
jgi:hypothetical protein